MAAFGFFKTGSLAVAQDNPAAKVYSSTNAATNTFAIAQNDSNAKTQDDYAAETTLEKRLLELRLGPFDLHPRLAAGLTYDDNILLSRANREADTIWMIQPALRAVAGDDAALIAYQDQHQYSEIFGFSPGDIIFQQPEERPGKLFLLDYGPGFQIFDKYAVNNFIDQSGSLNLLWPMDKLILGIRQDYQLEKTGLIWADQRAKAETVSSALSAAYQFDAKTTMESNFRRVSIGYYQPGLTGYTEYNTEDWFNYEVVENLPVSLGVLAGLDDVANHQDQIYEQLRGRVRYLYTEKIAFDVSGGGELRRYENGHPDTLSPVFTVVGEYHPAERTMLIFALVTGSNMPPSTMVTIIPALAPNWKFGRGLQTDLTPL